MEIQRTYLVDLVNRISELEIHLWNFSRQDSDNRYLQQLAATLPRTRIFNEYYEGSNFKTHCTKTIGKLCNCIRCRVGKWSEPYKYYANNPEHEETIYIKIDDDIVFVDTDRFPKFLEIAREKKGSIISANVINNGICALINPPLEQFGLQKGCPPNSGFDKWWMLCTSADFFRACHRYFFEHRLTLTREELKMFRIPRTQFSINTLAFGHDVMRCIANHLGKTLTQTTKASSPNIAIF